MSGPMKAYGEKLKDPRWQKRRLEILQRDEFTCQECGDSDSTLHVHHHAYLDEPWAVPDCWLITLCAECHESHTKSVWLNFKEFTDLFGIAGGLSDDFVQAIIEPFREYALSVDLGRASAFKPGSDDFCVLGHQLNLLLKSRARAGDRWVEAKQQWASRFGGESNDS